MSRKSFDYPNTCPDIDKQIRNFQYDLNNVVEDIMRELNPLLCETNDLEKYKEDYEKRIYSIAEGYFEKVRSINSDIRNAAEYQIDSLEEDKSDLEKEVDYLYREIDSFRSQISDLQEDLEYSKETIQELQLKTDE